MKRADEPLDFGNGAMENLIALQGSRSVASPAMGGSICVNLFRQSHKVNHSPQFSPIFNFFDFCRRCRK